MCDACDRAAYDPEHDPLGTLYGFTRAEWVEAAERYGGSAASIVALWDRVMRIRDDGQNPGVNLEALVALARLSPAHARRVVARLEPAFSRDWQLFAAAIQPDGQISREYLRENHPSMLDEGDRDPVWLAQCVGDLMREFALAKELRTLASA